MHCQANYYRDYWVTAGKTLWRFLGASAEPASEIPAPCVQELGVFKPPVRHQLRAGMLRMGEVDEAARDSPQPERPRPADGSGSAGTTAVRPEGIQCESQMVRHAQILSVPNFSHKIY